MFKSRTGALYELVKQAVNEFLYRLFFVVALVAGILIVFLFYQSQYLTISVIGFSFFIGFLVIWIKSYRRFTSIYAASWLILALTFLSI